MSFDSSQRPYVLKAMSVMSTAYTVENRGYDMNHITYDIKLFCGTTTLESARTYSMLKGSGEEQERTVEVVFGFGLASTRSMSFELPI